MTSFEKPNHTELRCAECPNRSKINRALVRVGIFEAGDSCPGPDTIERFDIIKKTEGLSSYDEYGDEHIDFNQPLDGDPKVVVGYFATKAIVEEPCPRDPILLAADETVTEARLNDQGKATVKIGKGDLEAAQRFIPSKDWNPAITDARPPREILDSIRLVEATGSEENPGI